MNFTLKWHTQTTPLTTKSRSFVLSLVHHFLLVLIQLNYLLVGLVNRLRRAQTLWLRKYSKIVLSWCRRRRHPQNRPSSTLVAVRIACCMRMVATVAAVRLLLPMAGPQVARKNYRQPSPNSRPEISLRASSSTNLLLEFERIASINLLIFYKLQEQK